MPGKLTFGKKRVGWCPDFSALEGLVGLSLGERTELSELPPGVPDAPDQPPTFTCGLGVIDWHAETLPPPADAMFLFQ